jgi:prepilin-type N-terminal cleavage/methylation domain-containing protein
MALTMTAHKRIVSRGDGFSLIEVLVAIAVFTIIALALASQSTRTILTNVAGRRITTSAVTASEQLEHMIPMSYNATRLSDGNHTSADSVPTEPGYDIQYEIRTGDTLPRTKTIKVTVTSAEEGGRVRSTTYHYLIPEII